MRYRVKSTVSIPTNGSKEKKDRLSLTPSQIANRSPVGYQTVWERSISALSHTYMIITLADALHVST